MKTFIKALELHGFKSFAKPTKIVFQPGINAIIGPNGSGKSNIVDALCFVLGKSRKKELRAERFENLIFNGGKGGKPSKFAKVTLILDNSSKVFPIEEDELRISRKVDYLGRVVYRIKGRRVTRGEVLSILSYANIKPEGFNIVLQGEIDELATMSSEERRKIIDDLAGISIYEEKKEKALRELQKVNEKINEAKILLEEKEKYLKDLEKDKEKAEEYVEISQRKKKYEAMLILKEISIAKREKEELERRINSMNSLIQKLSNRNREIEERINKLNERIESLSKEINSLNEEKKNLEEDFFKKRIKFNELELSLQNSNREIERVEERKGQISNSIKEVQTRIEELKVRREKIEEDIMKIRNEISKLEEVPGVEVKEDISKLREELDQVYNSLIKAQERLKLLEENMKKVGELEKLNKELKDLQEELEELDKEDSSLNKEIESLSTDLREFISQKNKLEAELISLQEIIERKLPRSVREILKLRDSGKIEGIIGTISELIRIKSGFEEPINSLLRGKENIVIVKDVDTAEKCIDFLKRNKIGIASFLPLNRIKGIYRKLNVGKDENLIDVAMNLVEYDEEFRDVIYWFLGDAIVVKELPNENLSYRVVTIDGKILEKSNLITGGFFGEEIKAQMNEIQMKLNNINEKIAELSSSISDRNSKRDDIIQRKIEIKGDISRIENLLRSIKVEEFDPKEIERKKIEIEKLEERKKILTEKIDSYIKAVSKIDTMKKLESLRKELAKLESEKSRIDGEINEVLLRDLRNLNTLFRSLEREKRNFIKNLKKISRERDMLSKDLEFIENSIRRIDEKIRKETSYKESTSLKLSKLKETFGRNEIKIEELKKKIDELNQRAMKLDEGIEERRGKFLEYGLEVEVPSISIEEIKEKIEELGKRLDSYGYVNLKALEVYKSVESEYVELKEKVEKISEERDKIVKLIEEVESKKRDAFFKVFNEIESKVQKLFSILSPEGEIKLELDNPEDPFSGGLEIKARFPGKKLLNMLNLSGGERVVVALSFLFAIQEIQPTPFYILDEIDAALDKLNSERLVEVLKAYSRNSQLILITHNDTVISSAEYIYGVSMQKNGESKIISIKVP